MKKKKICNYLDYAHISDIKSITGNTVQFFSGKKWTRITANGNVRYQSGANDTPAGMEQKETITLKAYDDDIADLLNNKKLYISQLFFDGQTHIIGSLNHPCVKNFRSNKTESEISFTVHTPMHK